MIKFSKANILQKLLVNAPIIVLFISVLNEFDFNYLELKYFSFNFPFILIFFWSLKKSESLGYGLIFLAGLFNDVVVGLPIGISSFCYLLICAITSYIRQITLSPKFINDWLSFIVAVLLINSIQVIILDLIFLYQVDYMSYLINSGFTFLFYPLFFILFNILNSKISLKKND